MRFSRASGDLRQLRTLTEKQFAAEQSNDLAAVAATQNGLNASRESWNRNLGLPPNAANH